jgi:hypothetical protein
MKTASSPILSAIIDDGSSLVICFNLGNLPLNRRHLNDFGQLGGVA